MRPDFIKVGKTQFEQIMRANPLWAVCFDLTRKCHMAALMGIDLWGVK